MKKKKKIEDDKYIYEAFYMMESMVDIMYGENGKRGTRERERKGQ